MFAGIKNNAALFFVVKESPKNKKNCFRPFLWGSYKFRNDTNEISKRQKISTIASRHVNFAPESSAFLDCCEKPSISNSQ